MVEVLKDIQHVQHPWVDESTGPLDDAAVVRQPGAVRSLVMTIDVITPIVDDPRAFGAIAAANSVSDVYAMGGRPEVALAFVGFPTDKLPLDALREVLQGIHDVCRRSACAIVGGHTVTDAEPKAGLAVTGSVDPARVWSHRSARAGQVLILTKAIGTGVIGNVIQKGVATSAEIAEATASMTAINDVACAIGLDAGATSCTDVTGFGLLGHLKHIVEASDVSAEVITSAVPLLMGARAYAERGLVPGGSKRNLRYVEQVTEIDAGVDEPSRLLLADAQTSGGLLLCVPEERAAAALARLRGEGCERSAIIGSLAPYAGGPRLRVRA